jgi:hypothetical protein
MPTEEVASWVVYRTSTPNQPAAANAVCEQREWDAIERAGRGRHLLVRSGIASEAEAERLARGTAGDPTPRRSGRPKAVAPQECRA